MKTQVYPQDFCSLHSPTACKMIHHDVQAYQTLSRRLQNTSFTIEFATVQEHGQALLEIQWKNEDYQAQVVGPSFSS